jgi:autotransporter adhesin
MPIDDFLDPAQESRRLKKAQQRAWVSGGRSGGDSDHLGAGDYSIALGDAAESPASRGVAIGQGAYADQHLGGYSTAIGPGAYADDDSVAVGSATTAAGTESVAIGDFANASGDRSVAIGKGSSAPNADDFVLGNASHNVIVPGTFSNPSARRLKENVTDAPELVSIFPTLYEWEYIVGDGRRHIGPMADDLVGTDAERFLIRDAAGEPASIQTVALLVAQVAQLNARVVALEEKLKG